MQKESARFLLRTLTRGKQWDATQAAGMYLLARVVRRRSASEHSCVPPVLRQPQPLAGEEEEEQEQEPERLFGILAQHIRQLLDSGKARANTALFQQVLAVATGDLSRAVPVMRQLLEALLRQEEQLGSGAGSDERGKGTAYALHELLHALLSLAKSAPDLRQPLRPDQMTFIELAGCMFCPECEQRLPAGAASCPSPRCGYAAPAWRDHDEGRLNQGKKPLKYYHKGGGKSECKVGGVERDGIRDAWACWQGGRINNWAASDDGWPAYDTHWVCGSCLDCSRRSTYIYDCHQGAILRQLIAGINLQLSHSAPSQTMCTKRPRGWPTTAPSWPTTPC